MRSNDADDAGHFSPQLAAVADAARAAIEAHIRAASLASRPASGSRHCPDCGYIWFGPEAMSPVPGADLAGMLDGRITAYLSGGGLWNPELANHDAVRDLLIDARAAFALVARERDAEKAEADRWARESSKWEKEAFAYKLDHEEMKARIHQAESALATAQAETAALRGVVEERIVDLTFEKQRHGVTCDCRTQFSCDDATTFLSKKIAGFRALLARPATEEGT
jgi:hypothetical protein